MLEDQLYQLATYLAGEFDNRQQSLTEPIWYLHLRLWHRPLPPSLLGHGYAFFIEQVSVASGQAPYRQRILHLTERNNQLWGQYYALVDPAAYSGGATDPERLAGLTRADLVDLPTCGVSIEYRPDRQTFNAHLPDDSLCSFTINGTTTYVRLRFEVGPETSTPASPVVFQMSDRGVDPATGKATWGPQMGPFCLVKQV
ncbi:MAG: chromophore lyase CpcT/CpeT, partial [Cyanobacteria bacterium J06638_6]